MKRREAIFMIIGLLAMTFVPSACSHIDEAERLTVVNVVERDTVAKPDTLTPDTVKTDTMDYFLPQGRHVLIEDFTGQNCVNCPNATDLIAQLQNMHGHDRVIAVGIHSGPLGVKASDNAEGLATDLGDTYYNYWHIGMQPYGVIDRSDGTLSTEWWSSKVSWDLDPSQPAPSVNIWVDANVGTDRKADIKVTLAAYEHCNAKLQLWIVEDNITAFQKMPDGTIKKDYVHNHVLRDAVNGEWGDDFRMEYQEIKLFHYTYDIPSAWNLDNLYMVAFAYNDQEVKQVARVKLRND